MPQVLVYQQVWDEDFLSQDSLCSVRMWWTSGVGRWVPGAATCRNRGLVGGVYTPVALCGTAWYRLLRMPPPEFQKLPQQPRVLLRHSGVVLAGGGGGLCPR